MLFCCIICTDYIIIILHHIRVNRLVWRHHIEQCSHQCAWSDHHLLTPWLLSKRYRHNRWKATWNCVQLKYPLSHPDDLTHWGRVTHICVSKMTNIGSDNGLSPGRCQAIIWTNAGILLIGPLWTNFSEILIEILTFSFKKVRLKVSSGKWRPFVSASMS